MNSGSILNLEPKDWADRLHRGSERKRSQGRFQGFGLSHKGWRCPELRWDEGLKREGQELGAVY